MGQEASIAFIRRFHPFKRRRMLKTQLVNKGNWVLCLPPLICSVEKVYTVCTDVGPMTANDYELVK